ncbi:MAG: ankyrin repeat domain-containing protein, partial [Nostoc sp.]|uniref:ankyrin repeat domain-containing protein n=1 Tax=Nostoc sp. TaxID=1180 RepID=UPI002FFAB39E
TNYGETPLHLAVSQGNKQVVELLIAKGADVNAKNKDGNTPLHLAYDLDIVKLLIAKGADANAKNNDDMTPAELQAQDERDRQAQNERDRAMHITIP